MVTVAGPILYLLGNLLYIRARFGGLALSRVAAIAALAAVGGCALAFRETLPVAVLSAAVLVILVVLGVQTARERSARE